mgnify:CR=1 FL=1
MKPFLFGKKNLEAPSLRPPPGMHAALGATRGPSLRSPGPAHGHDPVVEVIKEGDKVVRLVVTCGCGERIEVECLYPAGS